MRLVSGLKSFKCLKILFIFQNIKLLSVSLFQNIDNLGNFFKNVLRLVSAILRGVTPCIGFHPIASVLTCSYYGNLCPLEAGRRRLLITLPQLRQLAISLPTTAVRLQSPATTDPTVDPTLDPTVDPTLEPGPQGEHS